MSTDLHSVWRWRAGACLAAGLLAAPLAAAQQTAQPPSTQDVLKDLLREQLEDQLGGAKGKVRGVRTAGEEGGAVLLEVQLAGVKEPATARLECEVLDRSFVPIAGFACEHEPLVAGDATVAVRLAYSGASALSASLRVTLQDTATGRPRSQRRTPLVREWHGSGSAAGEALAAGAPADAEPGRAPVTVDVRPVPVGDTPLAGAAGGVAPRPGAPSRPAVVVPPPAPAERAPAGQRIPMQPRPTGALPLLDLYGLAPQARWSGPTGALPFGGADSDERGFVRALGRVQLSDGNLYDKVLQMHPAWRPDGYVSSTFDVTIPASATRFSARAGFLPGASASDGVTVSVILGVQKIATRTLRPADGVGEIAAEIPETWRGQAVAVHLFVAARATSTQDWFVWVAPAIH